MIRQPDPKFDNFDGITQSNMYPGYAVLVKPTYESSGVFLEDDIGPDEPVVASATLHDNQPYAAIPAPIWSPENEIQTIIDPVITDFPGQTPISGGESPTGGANNPFPDMIDENSNEDIETSAGSTGGDNSITNDNGDDQPVKKPNWLLWIIIAIAIYLLYKYAR